MDGMLLGLGLGALAWTGAAPDPDAFPVDRRTLSTEESWRPRPTISAEDDGALRPFRLTPLVLTSAGLRRDDPDWLRLAAEEPFPKKSDEPLRFVPHPWDVVVGVEKSAGSWGRGLSEVSIATELSRVLIPLNAGVFFGMNVDLLGFEEYEGSGLTLIDPRHGSPRLSNLSTGLGLTIKF
jgi:hypothetical protein